MTRKLYVRENGLPALVDESEIATPLPAGVVRFDEAQNFDDSAKAQARSNINALGVGETVVVSGTSGDIIAAQVTSGAGRNIWFGAGGDGESRGVYDVEAGRWLIRYATDDSYLHLPEIAVDGYTGTTSVIAEKDIKCTSGWIYAPKFVASSDRRLKKNLREIHPDLSSLKAYSYTLKTDGKKAYGLIAQDVQKVLPDAVTESTDEDHHLVLDYNAVVAALVSEVNDLKARISKLEGEDK